MATVGTKVTNLHAGDRRWEFRTNIEIVLLSHVTSTERRQSLWAVVFPNREIKILDL